MESRAHGVLVGRRGRAVGLGMPGRRLGRGRGLGGGAEWRDGVEETRKPRFPAGATRWVGMP